MNKQRRKQQKEPKQTNTLTLVKYLCTCCNTVFYLELYGEAERCPKCGNTSEFDETKKLTVSL